MNSSSFYCRWKFQKETTKNKLHIQRSVFCRCKVNGIASNCRLQLLNLFFFLKVLSQTKLSICLYSNAGNCYPEFSETKPLGMLHINIPDTCYFNSSTHSLSKFVTSTPAPSISNLSQRHSDDSTIRPINHRK